ncbi:MAG: hypothetical protein Q9211_005695 [Gyalolechia sp. 1 TL-2023]
MRAHKAALVLVLIWTFLKKRLGRREQMKSVTTAKAKEDSGIQQPDQVFLVHDPNKEQADRCFDQSGADVKLDLRKSMPLEFLEDLRPA